jgi:hypothetical protein
MRQHLLPSSLILICGLVTACPVLAVELIIDSFGAPEQALETTVQTGALTDSDTALGQDAAILGNWRDVRIDSEYVSLSPGGGLGNVDINRSGSNIVSIANDSGVQSTVSMLWDSNGAGLGPGTGAGSGTGFDLLLGGSSTTDYIFFVDVTFLQGNSLAVTFDLRDVSGNDASITGTAVAVAELALAFDDFVLDPGFDFSTVVSIEMSIRGDVAAWDANIDVIGIQGPDAPTPTPAPATWLLLLPALVALRHTRAR